MGWRDWLKGSNADVDPRLQQWRTDWDAACNAPTSAQAQALRQRLAEYGMDDERVEIEREMLEGLEAVVELCVKVACGGLHPIVTGHRAVGADRCYFTAPASLPDDPAQPSGTLLLTDTRAIFVGGARSLAVPWHSVTRCLRQDRDLLLIRAGHDDLHRLRCNSFSDVLRARFLAGAVTNRRL